MDLTQLKLKYILYFMQVFKLNINGTMFDVPNSMIVNMQIDKEYSSMIYPAYYVSINVPLWVYTEISKNPDNFSVFMTLQYKLSDNNENLVANGGTFHTEITGNFKAVASFMSPVPDSDIQTSVEKQNDAYKRNYTFNEYAIVELMLYNTNAWAASFDVMGGTALSSAGVTEALTYCLNKRGIKNVLLGNTTNYTQYREFKILPQSTIKNIMRIIEDYNFHSSGSIVFFDLTQAYILDKAVKLSAWKPNEFKTTHIVSLSEFSLPMSRFNGIHIDTINKYNVMSLNRDAFKAEEVTGSPRLQGVGEGSFMRVVSSQATLEMLTPNKEIILSIDNADSVKYNGKYRIHSVSVNFVPRGEYLSPTFEIYIRR